MFYRQPFDLAAAVAGCRAQWGVAPRRRDHATIEWGGRNIGAGSNIVWSNGLLDPWHGGGVLASISDTLVAVVIPEVCARVCWGGGVWVGGPERGRG
jgi:lysosomal Pro-X carboxypeptidase